MDWALYKYFVIIIIIIIIIIITIIIIIIIIITIIIVIILEIFDEIFWTNLQSQVWSPHIGVTPWDTNMSARK